MSVGDNGKLNNEEEGEDEKEEKKKLEGNKAHP